MRPGANRSSVSSRLLNVVVALATASGALFTVTPPAPVRAAPVLGGQLFSTGAAVEVVGTVHDVVDDNGSVLAHYEYGAFGAVVAETGEIDNDVLFQSREFDDITDLGYFRARFYDPALGRFVSEDPLEPFGYDFANNNPMVFVDPLGEAALFEYKVIISGRAFSVALHPAHHGFRILGKKLFCVHIQLLTYLVGKGGSGLRVQIPLPWCRGAPF